MGFRVIEQVRSAGRPSGEVRVSTCKNATVTLLSVFVGPEAMARAGFELGNAVRLLRGEEEDAGWIRVEKCDPVASARLIGKMPGTKGGNARFRAGKDWVLPMMTSTDIPEHEWRAEPGAVTLRLPALMRGVVVEGDQPDMQDKPAAMRAEAPATHAKALPRDQPAPRQSFRTEARSDLLRRLWPLPGMSVSEIRERLSALDGPPIPDTKTVLYHWAEALGLPTARSSQPGFAMSAQASPTVAPAGVPVASSTAARSTNGIDSRASLPTEHPDKAEAVQMLEGGQTARYVAEEFGLPIATVATWAAEVRARKQERAA